MKRYLILLSLVVILATILMISFKLSNDAIAVMVGVGLGILASIPTSVLLIFVLIRQNGGLKNPPSGLPQQQPPVIIVNGGHPPSLSAAPPPAAYQMMDLSAARTFTVVGDEATEL